MRIWSMAPVAVLIDGPLRGDLVPVELTDRRLAQRYVTVLVPVLDEVRETMDWTETRYSRCPLRKVRTDPDEPWEYLWWDRPERPRAT